jgi:hypothetical protein
MGAGTTTHVVLEEGRTWVFASALEWPGWCRRGKGEEAAIDLLLDYAGRYAVVAGPGFVPGQLEVAGHVKGNRTTDFGAPDARGPWDYDPLSHEDADRHVRLLEACWRYFDAVVASAPAQLRKGPRGGGRDRDAIASHVRGAERAYSAKVGARIPPRTPWPQQRANTAAALRTGVSAGAWPVRYAIRRCAWHVLDHAWKIEDKSD